MLSHGVAPLGLREDRLIDGRYLSASCRGQTFEPVENLRGDKPVDTRDTATRQHWREQTTYQAVDVKQRHQVEAAIVNAETVTLGDVPSRGDQIAVAERHELRP